MAGNVVLGDHTFTRMRLEDLDELPKILHAFHEAIGKTKSESASHLDQLKRLFENDGVAPEALASKSYLEYCKTRPETNQNDGQIVGIVQSFLDMWAAKPEAWPDLPESAETNLYKVRREMIVLREDPAEQVVKKPKLDHDGSSTILPNGEAACDSSEKSSAMQEEERLDESDLKKAKVEGQEDKLLTILGPDAPDGHESYKARVLADTNGAPIVPVRAKCQGRSVNFQISIRRCGNSEEAALRLARACYMRFQRGESMDEVKAFREDCISQFKFLDLQSNSVAAPSKSSAAPSPPVTSPEAATKDVDSASVKDVNDFVAPNVTIEMLEEFLPADAPADHEVYGKCKVGEDTIGNPVCRFIYKMADGTNKTFQVSVRKTCTVEAALRLARACYVKFESGASAEEVSEFRDECHAKLKPFAVPPLSGRAKASNGLNLVNGEKPHVAEPVSTSAASNEPATVVASAKSSRPKDNSHLSSEGINWDDILPEDAPADSEVWQKLKGKKTGRGDIRFKCSDGQQMQVTERPCLGDGELAFRVARAVYVRAEKGATKDELVAYRNELYALIESAATESAGKAERKDAESVQKKKSAEATNVKSRKVGSASSKSGSDSDSSSSGDSNAEPPQQTPNKIGNAVAKMAVRSGLRCPKTYALVRPETNGASKS
mmetsp:Transcript_6601/g.10554  ORF Transcript_6601/g.10554 Transcript_6601/m.10554 type:complete len:663 (-) Transcript_6601:108-2096(-)